MAGSIPIVIIVIAVILVVVALLALFYWRKQKVQPEQPILRNKKLFFIQWVTGLILALLAAFFMFDGDILGEKTTGIAMVICIVGICLLGASNITLISFRRK